jgi:hypothetical protein
MNEAPRLPAFGLILPKTLRERVFEPAYYDLLATLPPHTSAASPSVHLRTFGLVLDTLRVGSPRLAWHSFRRSRRLQVALGIIVLAVVGYFVAQLGGTYDPSATPRY